MRLTQLERDTHVCLRACAQCLQDIQQTPAAAVAAVTACMVMDSAPRVLTALPIFPAMSLSPCVSTLIA